MVVLTVVVTAGCAGDISGEQAVFKNKLGAYFNSWGIKASYNFYGSYVDITNTDASSGVDFFCTYKLNDNKTAWLKVSTDDGCGDASVTVP